MRLGSTIRPLLAAALLLAAGGAAQAQFGSLFGDPYAEERARERAYRQPPRPVRPYGGEPDRSYGRAPAGYEYQRQAPPQDYYGRRPAYGRAGPAPAPQPERYYWPWEDRPAMAPPQPAYVPRRNRDVVDEGRARRRIQRPAPVAREPTIRPKLNPTTHVAVFGDSLAELVGQGLDEAFEDNPGVVVFRRVRGDGGLVRKDVSDWPKLAQEYLAANPKLSYAIVMVGANDRQPIRDGDQSVEPLTDRWRELYRERVDALIRVFAERKVPVVWVGAPPMRNEGLSTDLIALNDIYRAGVQKAGGSYVDIWPGFVNDENRYAQSGPDVDGQTARLRTPDGVHFTHAGYRKAAHFADVEIKRLMEVRAGPPVVSAPVAAIPSPGLEGVLAPGAKIDDAALIDRMISASLPSLPEPQGLPSLPAKPASGPILPLTRIEVSPGGALATGRPRLDGDANYVTERTLNRGAPPPPQPGRADDFRWPPG